MGGWVRRSGSTVPRTPATRHGRCLRCFFSRLVEGAVAAQEFRGRVVQVLQRYAHGVQNRFLERVCSRFQVRLRP